MAASSWVRIPASGLQASASGTKPCSAQVVERAPGAAPRVDGVAIDYENWPLFGGPFVEAAVDSERLTLKHGGSRRELDFRTLEVRER